MVKLNELFTRLIHFLHYYKKTVLVFVLLFLVTIIVTAVITASFYARNEATKNNPSSSPTPFMSPSPTPTSKPTPSYIPGNANISSSGNIYVAGVEVFGGDLQGNSVNLGSLQVGDSKSFSFYIRSTSNFPVTLSLNATDWSPPGIDLYLSLSWNYNGTILNPGNQIPVTLTLNSPLSSDFENYLIENQINTFNFNINIFATQS